MSSVEYFALSQAQLRLIPSEIQNPGTTAYTISKRYVFNDIATDELIKRIANAVSSAMHLRLHQHEDGDVVQYMGEAPVVDIIDMSEASESDIERMRNERLYAVFSDIFDVALVKLTLMVLPEGCHELLAVFHHAIADGTTTIHFGERIESASTYDTGEYRSYVQAEDDYLNSEACKADVEWWANALELYSDSIVNDLPLAMGGGVFRHYRHTIHCRRNCRHQQCHWQDFRTTHISIRLHLGNAVGLSLPNLRQSPNRSLHGIQHP